MHRVSPFSNFTTPGAQRATAIWQTAASQPSWISRAVLVTFLLVIGIPIFLLVLLALLVATVVFALLWGANALMTKMRGVLPRRDGRQNVRVIQRNQDNQ